jgi:glycosyltransferase involved in cell wall biosynthesis
MKGIKILYYNWLDFEDPELRGGGVSVYQRNLVDAAARRGDAAWFLSSGSSYSPFSRRPFIREVKAYPGGVRKFELVNSAVLSPGQAAFGKEAAAAPEMEAVFADFLRTHGPFDVVHFNNLEGIPVSFLRLAREHDPRAKVVYSMHNYFAFCPQVNLWFQERAACKDFRGGRKCVNCLVKPPNAAGVWRTYQVDYGLRMLGIRPPAGLYRAASWLMHGPVRALYLGVKVTLRAAASLPDVALGRRPWPWARATKSAVILDAAGAARFAARRRLFVDALNAHADHVLAVSRRVAELAVGFGVDPAKVQTLTIGTRYARAQSASPAAGRGSPAGPAARGPRPAIRIAYLGYMRRDKGFYFYLRALEKMPAGLARRLGLVFAAKVTDLHAYHRIKRMAHRFDAVTFYDGYTHAQLPRILSGVDLGVVPVLWEDNLPQVAIECVASGVPVLTSDRGGARELLDCPALVFKAGSRADFYARLRAVLDDPALLRTALAGRARLDTPEEHYDRLRAGCYRAAGPDGPRPGTPRGEARALAAGAGLCPTSP